MIYTKIFNSIAEALSDSPSADLICPALIIIRDGDKKRILYEDTLYDDNAHVRSLVDVNPTLNDLYISVETN